jgi:hypothetical protein
LVPLKSFEAGWGWDAQVRQYVRKKYKQDLAGLVELDPQPLARLLRGEVLKERPYATIQWVLRLAPFRPLELYWLFDFDEEFGHDLHVLFAPKSLVVPTEDAYVFAWDYLALLARYGRGAFPLVVDGPGPDWLPFNAFAPTAGPIKDVALGPREELLQLVDADLAEVAVTRMDCGACRPLAGNGWEAVWPVLGDLAIRLRCHSQSLEVAFDNHGASKYGPEFLMSFAWLYINAFLRECRQVEPSLPRLSRYL